MSDRFDFEQQIQKCWVITDDLADVAEGILENNLDKDQIVNALTGIGQLYELKFNKLWELFESVHMKLVRDEKMGREECAALRAQLYDAEFSKYGAGKGVPSGAGADGFGIAAIKPNKKSKK
jgi:hypothetical protein